MSDYKIELLSAKSVEENIDAIKCFIEMGFEFSDGKYVFDDVKESILSANMQVWGVVKDEKLCAALLTQIIHFPHEKRLLLFSLGGDGFKKWGHLLRHIENWAAIIKVSAIELFGRRGWIKLLKDEGYEEINIVLRKRV